MRKPASRALRLLPDSTYTTIQIKRRVKHWRSVGAIFIHVPKAAGVSMSRALYGRPLGHFAADEVRKVVPADFEDLYTFAIVRDPVDRLQSAYAFARQGSTGEMGVANPGTYQGANFDSFERFVQSWLANQDVQTLDGIFRPQAFYVCHDDRIAVDGIFKLEELDAGVATIEARLGIELRVGHHNVSRRPWVEKPSFGALRTIWSKYERDFEMLGYARRSA